MERDTQTSTAPLPIRAGGFSALRTFVWVAVAAATVVAPMAFRGDASGHDFAFHLSSWMDVAAQWRQGIVYPRWAEWANWGFGEPRFIFYPPLSWMLGAAIGSVLPWKMAASTFIWLALAGAGISMHKLAREWIAEPQATIAAILYVVNPYNLVIVYYRSAFGELLAVALMPLLVWAVLRVTREGWGRVPALAFVFAAIWLADAPAAVIATYSLVLLLATGCALGRSWRPMAHGATAMAGGFGLAAFYILPAAWERRWVQIALATADSAEPVRNFLFTRSNAADFIAFNWKVSACVAGMAVVTAMAAALAWRKRERRDIWWMLTMLGAASLLLMLPVSALLWSHLPELRFIQFPWRWTGVLAVAFALFTAAAIDFSRKRAAWIVGVALAAAIGCSATLMVRNAWWDADGAPDISRAIQGGRGYEGTDEYQPVGSDRLQLPGNPDGTERPAGVSPNPAPRIAVADLAEQTNGLDDNPARQKSAPFANFAQDAAPENSKAGLAAVTNSPPSATRKNSSREGARQQAEFRVERWTAEQKDFTVSAQEPTVAALRLLAYPAWQVRVDGKLSHFHSQPETGQMLVPVPTGEHSVDVRFVRTWDRELGDISSVVALMAIAVFGFRARKQPQS